MADRKITALTALTSPATGDLFPIVDVSEAQTQELLFGLGFGSEAGINGQFIFEERSFDLTAFPWRVGYGLGPGAVRR